MLTLQKLLDDRSSLNLHFVLITGDFNARYWSTNDTPTTEGVYLDTLMTLYSIKKLITKPTHVLEHSSSGIDLIFTNQPNLVRESEIHLLFTQNAITRSFTAT